MILMELILTFMQRQSDSRVIVGFLLVLTALSAYPANLTPVAVTGFNWDVVVENTSAGPPYITASELNSAEGNAFYQSGLSGKSPGYES